jgi:hypothetical protein
MLGRPMLMSGRQPLDRSVEILPAFEERFHDDVLILAVGAISIIGKAGVSESRNPRLAQMPPVG